jgi:predicted nucleic acid-binding protein
VAAVGSVVRPAVKLAVLADEPDNRILECAVEGNAGLIVTGDRHLLELKQHGAARIVTLVDFLRPP